MKKLLLFMFIMTLITACAHQPVNTSYDPPGFFMGIFHGLIAPISLIVGFFSEVRVYAFPNSGWWYDLGFMLGISSSVGAATSANR